MTPHFRFEDLEIWQLARDLAVTFENASMLLVFEAMHLLSRDEINPLLEDCDKLSRMITNYSRTR